MSEYSLYGQRISETYPRVLQITSGDTVLDGSGDTRSLFVSGNFTANTLFIGSSDISGLFAPIDAVGSGATTFIGNGVNTFTAGTPTRLSINITGGTFDNINVTGLSAFNSVTAATIDSQVFLSAGTDLYSVFSTTDTNTITRVQPGLNIYTGGTPDNPTINLSALTVISISSTTISGDSYFSGNTALFDVFHSDVTGSTFLQPNVLAIGSSSSGITYDTRFFLTGNTLHGAHIAFGSYMSSGGTSDLIFRDFNTGARQMRITHTNGYVMIASNDELVNLMPTALLDIGSGTTLRASLRIRSGQTLTNKFDGDIWNDGSNLYAQIGGSTQQLNGTTGGASTYIQHGLNTYTGGTSSAPTVNISAATLSYLSASTISGGTIISGSTDLYQIFATTGATYLPTNQIAFGSSSSGLTGSNSFTFYDGTTKYIDISSGGAQLSFNSSNNTSSVYGGGSVFYIRGINSNSQISLGETGLLNYYGTSHNFYNGNVGIGTSLNYNPTNKLEVIGDVSITGITKTNSLSATTLSGGTITSGSTNLYDIFAQIGTVGGSSTYVQPGSNITTGGTDATPSVNVVDSPSFAGIQLSGSGISARALSFSATTLSGETIFSGSTDIDAIFHRKSGYLLQKAGSVSGSTFTGSPRKRTVTFSTAFPSNSYTVNVTGEINRTWTVESKSSSGFTINANSSTAFATSNVFWNCCEIGEGYR